MLRKLVVSLLFFALCVLGNYSFSQSLDDLKRNYQKAIESNDKNSAINNLNQIANYYWERNQHNEAIQSFEELIKLAREIGNRNAQRVAFQNIAMIYSDIGEYQKSENSLKENLNLNRELNDKAGITAAYTNLATACMNQKKYDQAAQYAEEALKYAKELNNLNLIRNCLGLLVEIYQRAKNAEKQAEYFSQYSAIDKHIKQQEISQVQQEKQQIEVQKAIKEKELAEKEQKLEKTQETLKQVELITKEQQLRLELQEAEKQRIKEQAEAELRRQALIRNFMLIVIVIVLLFSSLLIVQIRKTKLANKLLAEKNEEIERQKNEIEKQSEKIKASIQYARRIQAAVLPPHEYFEKLFPDSFIFFKPRDIVSGDFYWVTEKGDKTIVTVADCTGHGVPGAFMSMLGTAFLSEIVNKIVENKHISELQAGEILTELRRYIINSLHQKGDQDEAKDGMDIVLVIIDHKNHRLQYAGANNPLYMVRNKELMVFDPDPMPIAYQKEMSEKFKTIEIDYQPNDTIYLSTDGYVDQFGGQHGRKFMIKRFKQLLVEINSMTMRKQYDALDKTMEAWRGNYFQVDDMLIVGIRLIPTIPQREISREMDWSDKTILIVEDVEANYLYMTEALRRTGVAMLHARTGHEAIELISHTQVDLILMDINMPGIDGFETTRQLRSRNITIPIIAQTAMKIDNIEKLCSEAGFSDLIIKPVRLQTFIETIQKHLM